MTLVRIMVVAASDVVPCSKAEVSASVLHVEYYAQCAGVHAVRKMVHRKCVSRLYIDIY